MGRKINIKFGRTVKEFEVIENPIPHILVDSKKEIHGWYRGYSPRGERECTAERMLLNPYAGCTHDCFFCYAHAMYSYYMAYRKEKVVTVFRDYDKVVAEQLDKINVGACGYLSAVTDPLQPINDRYRLTEKLIDVFNSRGLPVDIITKARIGDEVVDLMKGHPKNFAQVTILTLDEDKRRKLTPGGASVDVLLDNVERVANAGIYTVVRVDPLIPYVTDDEEDLAALIKEVAGRGARHIITSMMDIPPILKSDILAGLGRFVRHPEQVFFPRRGNGGYNRLIMRDWNFNLEYRKNKFQSMREECDKNGLTFALCMEFEKTDQRIGKDFAVRGLNKNFMSSRNCEGLDTPIYIKRSGKFEPVGCRGDCLNCNSGQCGIPDLKKGGSWKLKDYRRWSRDLP